MTYRTKTYLAADWDEDIDLINQLRAWNNNDWYALDFVDAHEYTQARDNSLNCSIKRSLKERLDRSKTFVLIVGNETKNKRAGSCQFCNSYNSYNGRCGRNHDTVTYQSYIEYECEQAIKAGMKIVVIYKSYFVNKSKCPEILKNLGTHIPAYDTFTKWNYSEIKNAICD